MEVEHQNLYGGFGIVRIDIVDLHLVPPFVSVLQYKLDPTASIGLHQHQMDSSVMICTAGEGTVVINGEPSTLTVHGTATVPRQAQVSIQNASNEDTFEFWMVRARR